MKASGLESGPSSVALMGLLARRCSRCGALVPRGMKYCPDPGCFARVRWSRDKSVELHVMGVADEVESVTRRLVSGLGQSRMTAPEGVDVSTDAARWPSTAASNRVLNCGEA
jgi:hypothetical protein